MCPGFLKPFNILRYYFIFGGRNYFFLYSLTVSIESLVWIALDRFVAVVWPMKFHLITSRFRSFTIASAWIVALTVNSLDLYLSDLLKENGKIGCIADTLQIGYFLHCANSSYNDFILRYSSYLAETR